MSLVNKSTHIHIYDQYMQIVTSIGTRENLHHIRAISSVPDILHYKDTSARKGKGMFIYRTCTWKRMRYRVPQSLNYRYRELGFRGGNVTVCPQFSYGQILTVRKWNIVTIVAFLLFKPYYYFRNFFLIVQEILQIINTSNGIFLFNMEAVMYPQKRYQY